MLTNLDISELLALEGEREDIPAHRRRAYRRAARAALSWEESASEIVARGGSLSESLRGIGPYLSSVLRTWMGIPLERPSPPPLRDGFLSRQEVRRILDTGPNFLPPLYGDLHAHTVWSDGKSTLWEMAEAAEERGYAYLAITDHAAGLKIAGGLTVEKLLEQGERIAEINGELTTRGFRVRLLHSTELNITPQGEVDYDEELLGSLDFAIGAFHSKLRLADDQTERYIKALRHPLVDVLAHPRGRIFNHRAGLQADWSRVFEEAARLGKAIEVDGLPDRQDASPELLRLAVEKGTFISLGSDSHHARQLGCIEYSLAAVIRAGVPPEKILNFMTLEELMAWRKVRLTSASQSR